MPKTNDGFSVFDVAFENDAKDAGVLILRHDATCARPGAHDRDRLLDWSIAALQR